MAVWYPVELEVSGHEVVVVGGGKVAARKVAGLVDAGARVRVVSPSFGSELERRGDIRRERRPYAPEVLAGARLAFACTDDRSVNARVAADAREAGVWCNVADDPGLSDFLLPAALHRGRLTVAVGTGGASPQLAAVLRDRLASHVTPAWATLADELARARSLVRERIDDAEVRRRIFETLCAECSLKLLQARGVDAWRRWLERVVAHRGAALPDEPDEA